MYIKSYHRLLITSLAHTRQKHSHTYSMTHAELVRYMVAVWEHLLHGLYFLEHASHASWEYIPAIIIRGTREPEPEHLRCRGDYRETHNKLIRLVMLHRMCGSGLDLYLLTGFDNRKLDCVGLVHCNPW